MMEENAHTHHTDTDLDIVYYMQQLNGIINGIFVYSMWKNDDDDVGDGDDDDDDAKFYSELKVLWAKLFL